MTNRTRVLIRLCWLVPLVMLAANLLAWLRYGTDFPFFDDWRAYAAGDIRSFDLARLFEVVNNTMSPVGFALDTAAQRWLDGNAVAYQFLSMLLVLGGLLWLQWKLLEWAVVNPLVRGIAFAFTVFMLQSATYWGEQNLAYHQALPLLFLLSALWVILAGRWNSYASGSLVLALGVLAGLSYISGAVGATVMGALLLLCERFCAVPGSLTSANLSTASELNAFERQVKRGARWLMLAGVSTTLIQFYATRVIGGSDGSQAFPTRLPIHADFWVYLLGKVGRSLGSPFKGVGWEIALAAGMALALVLAFLFFIWRVLTWRNASRAQGKGPPATSDETSLGRLAYVYLPLSGVVLVYLGLVAFGRAGFRDASIQSLQAVFQFSYERFHFFWVTLLFPWAAAVGLSTWNAGRRRPLGAAAALCVLALSWGLAGARGVFDVSTYYEQGARTRATTLRCMSQQLGSGSPIMCPEFSLPGWKDWTPAFIHARQIGASFTKYFPMVAHASPERWLFEGRPQGQQGVSWFDVTDSTDGWQMGGADPQLTIESAEAEPFARCRMLEVRVRMRSEHASTVQVFYRPDGTDGFSEALSARGPVAASPGVPLELRFGLESLNGFAPVIRIDPVAGNTRFLIDDVRIGCGLQAP